MQLESEFNFIIKKFLEHVERNPPVQASREARWSSFIFENRKYPRHRFEWQVSGNLDHWQPTRTNDCEPFFYIMRRIEPSTCHWRQKRCRLGSNNCVTHVRRQRRRVCRWKRDVRQLQRGQNSQTLETPRKRFLGRMRRFITFGPSRLRRDVCDVLLENGLSCNGCIGWKNYSLGNKGDFPHIPVLVSPTPFPFHHHSPSSKCHSIKLVDHQELNHALH